MKQAALILTFVFSVSPPPAPAQEHTARESVVAGSPQWEKLKSLTGEWEGYAAEAGRKVQTRISVRMTGDGSALMHWMGEGSPEEMITMFHMDKTDLLATHYCAAHNQPRLLAVPSEDTARIQFDFKDGTNIRPGDGYMQRLVLTFQDQDHHDEEWGYYDNGKIQSLTFHMTRVKPSKQ